MLRFLKWIFLIFGGLALAILSFFFIQNKHDLSMAWDHKDKLTYDYLQNHCLEIEKNYYYPCFHEKFEKYLKKVSLTGMSLGLKLAFNFMDEDKKRTQRFSSETEKDIAYSLNYLEINNLAMRESYQRFHGLDFTYGGFVGKVQDNLEKATAFSDGIIKGLKGKEGITELNNPVLEEKYYQRLEKLEKIFHQRQKEIQQWLDVEVKKLEELYG